MRILAFDTSTPWCSVALGDGDTWLQRDEPLGQTHSEHLLPIAQSLLAEAGWTLDDIEGIAFGAGPGSFTGVRIACGVAQGLAFGLDRPVLGITTLHAVAQEAWRVHGTPFVLAAIDARMREIYTAAYRREGGNWHEASAPAVLTPSALTVPDDQHPWAGVGNAFAALPELGRAYAFAQVLPDVRATGRAIGELALPRFANGEGVSADEALPLYVRHRVALTTAERDAGLRL